ncbi:type VII secretion protein EccB [Streptosporangium lutulentum]|uniref:Type VII secretion protein EccB n=1 Tax=Streptosporangium lutulentum TaxID=1461250 RepID=A0ABT9QRM9_9ACTN|nr:type VII secretion protein EccB [Streptosporangium lutulentum]MDP9849402.1 type VII secretion protein EccB [Streptosporangium lutulentum]
MQTRRDLYQAHKMMVQRLNLALLQGEPDLPESPMRRLNMAMFCGVLAAVLVMAGFGIYGLLFPGGATGLTKPGTVIVEEESGATFVYSEPQKEMIPVANLTSARLLLGEQEVTVTTASSASLKDFQRGTKVGIPGAPESPPARDKLVRAPWSACVVEGTDAGGERRPYTSLIGGMEVGGRPVTQDSAMIVEGGDQLWLLWSNQRMLVPADSVRALPDGQRRQVPEAWLNALPVGSDFRRPEIPGFGRAAYGPGGKRSVVGRVYKVPPLIGAPEKLYVLLSDGLASLTPLQADLLLQNPDIKKAYGQAAAKPIETDAASANAMKVSATRMDSKGLPPTLPNIIVPNPTDPLCAVYSGTERGSTKATLTIESTVRIPPPPTGRFNPEAVDQVVLPPGTGVLAGNLPGDGRLDSVQSLYLIDDQGRRYAIQSPEALQSLGYTMEDVAPVPAHLMHLIPEGPVLDPAAAKNPVPIIGR